jgi:hypothetical protein
MCEKLWTRRAAASSNFHTDSSRRPFLAACAGKYMVLQGRMAFRMIALMEAIRSADSPPVGPFQNPAPILLILCALLIGLLLGVIAPAPEQFGMHGALVLAGIVNYPPQSPMSAYFLDSWTIIHQFGALLLRAGIHQTYVNKIIFVVPCALLVCAYSMIIYGFSGRFLLSLLGASLCYLANPLARLFASPDYRTLGLLWSEPSGDTFGLWAQIGAVWVIGCVAAGRNGLAGFSALVLIAVHPVLGTYMAGLAIAVFLGAKYFKVDMRGLAKGMAWGAGLTMVSFVFYLKMRSGFSAVTDHAAFDTYMRVWDFHRNQPMTITRAFRIGVAALLSIALLSAFIMFMRPRRNAAVLTSALVVLAVIISTIAYFVMHVMPNLLPEVVVRAMPGRLLNVQAYVSTPLVLAITVCVADNSAKYWTATKIPRIAGRLPVVILLVVIASGACRNALSFGRYSLVNLVHGLRSERASTQDDSDAFWHQVRSAGVSGLVLESPEALAPTLYHGHLPVALYQSFDFIPYLPQTAGAIARVVEEGYGVSFFNPPPNKRYDPWLEPNAVRRYWAQLASDDWCRISRDIGIVAVVAPSGWTIRLPILVPGAELTLYSISCSN